MSTSLFLQSSYLLICSSFFFLSNYHSLEMVGKLKEFLHNYKKVDATFQITVQGPSIGWCIFNVATEAAWLSKHLCSMEGLDMQLVAFMGSESSKLLFPLWHITRDK